MFNITVCCVFLLWCMYVIVLVLIGAHSPDESASWCKDLQRIRWLCCQGMCCVYVCVCVCVTCIVCMCVCCVWPWQAISFVTYSLTYVVMHGTTISHIAVMCCFRLWRSLVHWVCMLVSFPFGRDLPQPLASNWWSLSSSRYVRYVCVCVCVCLSPCVFVECAWMIWCLWLVSCFCCVCGLFSLVWCHLIHFWNLLESYVLCQLCCDVVFIFCVLTLLLFVHSHSSVLKALENKQHIHNTLHTHVVILCPSKIFYQ